MSDVKNIQIHVFQVNVHVYNIHVPSKHKLAYFVQLGQMKMTPTGQQMMNNARNWSVTLNVNTPGGIAMQLVHVCTSAFSLFVT